MRRIPASYRRVFAYLGVLAAACVLVVTVARPALAADGQVMIFAHELRPMNVYQNPVGCQKIPVDAHILINLTDKPVSVYADPFCVTPSLSIQPGHATHVSLGTGSFNVSW